MVYTKKSNVNPSPVKVIEDKLRELWPYLQDDDVGEQLELEGDEETTIIEFIPRARHTNDTLRRNNKETETFKENLKKYKKQRDKIKLALEKESVSYKTKQIVTRTLDELIATLVERKCPQKVFQNNEVMKMVTLRNNFIDDFIIPNIKFKSNTSCYINKIKLNKKDCKVLRESSFKCKVSGKELTVEECMKYLNVNCTDNGKELSGEECIRILNNVTDSLKVTIYTLNNNSENFAYSIKQELNNYLEKLFKNRNDEILDFYAAFTETVSEVLRNSDTISDNYKVKCTLVDMDKEKKKNVARQRDICNDFRICSEELKEFLTIFHRSLNYTVVRVLTNYAAMYEKDIAGDESEEKNTVISTLNRGGERVAARVDTVFAITTSKIALDKNKDRDTNVAVLRQYVKHTIKQVNMTIVKHLEDDLKNLRASLLFAIKDDLNINLATDLKLFERDVLRQLCSFFVTCKGNLFREHSIRKQFAPKRDNNSVFVKIDLILDVENHISNNNKHTLKEENVIEMRKQYSINTNKVTRTTAKATTMIDIGSAQAED